MSGEIPAPTIALASEAGDVVTSGLVARYLATIGRDPREASSLPHAPVGLHWCLALEVPGADELLADGIAEGGIIPTLELPRRMWGGSEISFLAPMPVGASVLRRSRLLDIVRKQGRNGPLAFARIEHAFSVAGQACLREVQSIAFRASEDVGAAPPGQALPQPVYDSAGARLLRVVLPDQAMLFRYSALTFNAHLIHYDRAYSREVEHYPELLVHGPLTASLMLEACARAFGSERLAMVRFRAVAPALCGAPVEIMQAADGAIHAVSGGVLVMTAAVELRPA